MILSAYQMRDGDPDQPHRSHLCIQGIQQDRSEHRDYGLCILAVLASRDTARHQGKVMPLEFERQGARQQSQLASCESRRTSISSSRMSSASVVSLPIDLRSRVGCTSRSSCPRTCW